MTTIITDEKIKEFASERFVKFSESFKSLSGFFPGKHQELYQNVLSLLQQQDITFLRVSFSGGGDQGAIDYISVLIKEDPSIETYVYVVYNDPFIEFCYAMIGYDIDWYNNEGGQGRIEFTVSNDEDKPSTITIDIEVNVIHIETAFSDKQEFKLPPKI